MKVEGPNSMSVATTEREQRKSLPNTNILWKVEPSVGVNMSSLGMQVARRHTIFHQLSSRSRTNRETERPSHAGGFSQLVNGSTKWWTGHGGKGWEAWKGKEG